MNINPDDWTPVIFPDEIELHDFFDKWNGIAIFSHTTIQKVDENHSFMKCKRYALYLFRSTKDIRFFAKRYVFQNLSRIFHSQISRGKNISCK